MLRLMVFFAFVLIMVVIAVAFMITHIMKISSKEGSVLRVMQQHGTVIDRKNKDEYLPLFEQVIKVFDKYVNGPDQSVRQRHTFTPSKFVKTQNRLLVSLYVQRGMSSGNIRADYYVAEIHGNDVSHIVLASDYMNNNGNFTSLPNSTFIHS